ncbi:MAG: hypothetical protein AABY01_02210 [Nanoarchaeota archaeon]
MKEFLLLPEIVLRHDAIVVDATVMYPLMDSCARRAEYRAELEGVLRAKNVVTHPLEHAIVDFANPGELSELMGERVVPYAAFETAKYARLAAAVSKKLLFSYRGDRVPAQDAGGLALALLFGTMVSTGFLTTRRDLAGYGEHLAKSLQLDVTPYMLVPRHGAFLHPDRGKVLQKV